ncbi:UNVERIFIED_CONTAM: hypothetical protein HDU68_009690 [Siphonaria sp. JEL0065]|nr:hypothetical protein HDU68_009690 [Siphonaria sp. JEL0065]
MERNSKSNASGSAQASPATPRSKSKSLSILHNPLDGAMVQDEPPVPKLPSAHRLTFADTTVVVPPPPLPIGGIKEIKHIKEGKERKESPSTSKSAIAGSVSVVQAIPTASASPVLNKRPTIKRSYSLKTPSLSANFERKTSNKDITKKPFSTGIISRDEEEEEEEEEEFGHAAHQHHSVPKLPGQNQNQQQPSVNNLVSTSNSPSLPPTPSHVPESQQVSFNQSRGEQFPEENHSHHGLATHFGTHPPKEDHNSSESSGIEAQKHPDGKRRGSILTTASNSIKRSISRSKKPTDTSIKSHGSSLNLSSDMLSRALASYDKYRARAMPDASFLKLPSIGYYNLIHAVLGSLGKVGFVTGTGATCLIAKEYVASSLVKKGKGVSLATVAVPPSNFNPPEGATLRLLFVGSLFVVEGAMWYLILLMQWTPVSTELGIFDCIPATYPTRPTLLKNVPGFLQGDTSLGVLYNYGLPLQDGLIGGWAAWPLAAPSRKFDVERNGLIYAYSVTCGDLEVATPKSNNDIKHPHRIEFQLEQSELWTDRFYAVVKARFPAGHHSWRAHENEDVYQKCVVDYVMGEGHIKFTFVADEWEMVTGGQMDEIVLSGNQLLTKRDPGSVRFFDDVVQYVGSTTKHIETVDWFKEAFTDCMNETWYDPTQQGGLVNMFQWGAGYEESHYDLNQTWQGVAGAMGAMSHYILMQYNGSAVADCRYSGVQESGIIDIPDHVSAIMLVAVIVCFVTQSMQLLRWALTSGGGPKTDRVALVLNSPLLLLFHLRHSITSIIPDIKSGDHSTRSIRKHMKGIFVRLGEDKRTRGEAVGNLIIATPKNVVAMNDKREYN